VSQDQGGGLGKIRNGRKIRRGRFQRYTYESSKEACFRNQRFPIESKLTKGLIRKSKPIADLGFAQICFRIFFFEEEDAFYQRHKESRPSSASC